MGDEMPPSVLCAGNCSSHCVLAMLPSLRADRAGQLGTQQCKQDSWLPRRLPALQADRQPGRGDVVRGGPLDQDHPNWRG